MNKIINACLEIIKNYTGNTKELHAALMQEMSRAPYQYRAYIWMTVEKELRKSGK